MRKADIGIIILVVIIGIAGWSYTLTQTFQSGGTAHIYVDGDLYTSVNLDEDQTVEVITEAGSNTLEVKDGYIDMISATCRDQLCVHMKHINKQGESIVCLPFRVHVEIEADQEVEVDAISN
jgi:hypothetical protein